MIKTRAGVPELPPLFFGVYFDIRPVSCHATHKAACLEGYEIMKKASELEAEKPRLDLYYILFIFLFCSFIGWAFETVSVAISSHQLTERGYLFVLEPLPHYFPFLSDVPLLKNMPLILGLPMIEIYGFGAVLSILGFRRLTDHPVWLFLTGMAVLTLFELLGSYFCTGVLHKTYWDYSGQFLNFQGRICLMSSLAWGTGALLAVKCLSPLTSRLYQKTTRRRFFRIITAVLMIGAVICALCKYWWFADILS